ncbi:MAG: site-specific integrase [Deltaproteobacteria bacterium]|nr:site-specific integrase [Deltaproteobacteria bacterium]
MGTRKTAFRATGFPGVRCRDHPTRKNGRHADVYYTVRYGVNGHRHEDGLGWASEGWTAAKAYAVLSELKANIKTGIGPQTLADRRDAIASERAEEARRKRRAGLTVRAFWERYYLPAIKDGKRTWEIDDLRAHKLILPCLGDIPLAKVTAEDVRTMLGEVRGAAGTVRHYLAIIRRMFNVAAKTYDADGVALFHGRNPCSSLEIPKLNNARTRYLTKDEARLIIEEAGKLRLPDLKHAIIVSLNTGLRAGEIERMAWQDIDFFGKILRVPDQARRKPGGAVPLNEAVLRVLGERRGQVSGPLVFPTPRGGVHSRLTELFRGVVGRTGLNDGVDDRRHRVVFHTLRHTFASWLAIHGTDIYRIKTLMRHRTLQMTMRYAHLIPDQTRDAVDRLALE